MAYNVQQKGKLSHASLLVPYAIGHRLLELN